MTKRTRTRFAASIGAAVALALTVTACAGGQEPGTGTGDAEGMDIVTLRHSWVPDQITLPYAAAKEFGFYEDEGIILVDQPGNGGATGIQLVANGEVMFGTGESAHLISAQDRGIDMISVMQQYQEQPMAVIALKDSGIETWEDLRGKSIGGTVASSGHVGVVATLGLNGIAEDEFDFVNLSPGAHYAALLEGEIDAAGSFIGNLAALDFYDDLVILPLAEGGYLAPSTTLFATPEFVEANEDLVERFVRATLRGLQATLEDPAAAAEAMAGQYANVDPEALEATFLLDAQFIATAFTDENGLGLHNSEAWAQQVDILTDLEQIGAGVDPTLSYTNEFVERIDMEYRTFVR